MGRVHLEDLFTLGDATLRHNIREVAFGSLLHTVQDSFAKSHVERRDPLASGTCPGTDQRAPGEILEFHVYSRQDSSKHQQYDGLSVFEEQAKEDDPDVVDVGKVLVGLYSRGAAWQEAKPYLRVARSWPGTLAGSRIGRIGRFGASTAHFRRVCGSKSPMGARCH